MAALPVTSHEDGDMGLDIQNRKRCHRSCSWTSIWASHDPFDTAAVCPRLAENARPTEKCGFGHYVVWLGPRGRVTASVSG